MEDPIEKQKQIQEKERRGESWKLFLENFEKRHWPIVERYCELSSFIITEPDEQIIEFARAAIILGGTFFEKPKEVCLVLKEYLLLDLKKNEEFVSKHKNNNSNSLVLKTKRTILEFRKKFLLLIDEKEELVLSYIEKILEKNKDFRLELILVEKSAKYATEEMFEGYLEDIKQGKYQCEEINRSLEIERYWREWKLF